MPRKQTTSFLLSFALLCATAPIGAKDAPITKEPILQKQSAARGGQVEKELSDKRSIKTAPKKLPVNAEIRKTLIKGDRPAVRFLLKKQAEEAQPKGGYGLLGAGAAPKHPAPNYPQHQNTLKNDKIRPPKQFEIEYTLDADADIRFTLLSVEGVPIATSGIKKGEIGARKGKNKRIIWDGRNTAGKEAPLGEYLVHQEIEYEKENIQRRVFTVVK